MTAEYAMLPAATQTRTTRESSSLKRDGRSVEISRLIGRSLRPIVLLDKLGENTIYIDCDVLQADGGTRTACITGASLALRSAVNSWLAQGIIREDIMTDAIAAVSAGVVKGIALLDLDYSEDSKADADFNFVLTKSGRIIEMQGAAEQQAVSWEQFEEIRKLACSGVQQLFLAAEVLVTGSSVQHAQQEQKAPLFSLGRRQQTNG